MPPVSRLDQMPEDDRRKVQGAISENRYANIRGTAEQLAEQGIEIPASTLGRWARQLKLLQGSVALAREIQEAAPDETNAVTEVATRIAQEKFLAFMAGLNEGDLDLDGHYKLSRTANAYAQASVRQKKFYQEVREKLEAKFTRLEETSAARALDPETLRIVREEIYGIL